MNMDKHKVKQTLYKEIFFFKKRVFSLLLHMGIFSPRFYIMFSLEKKNSTNLKDFHYLVITSREIPLVQRIWHFLDLGGVFVLFFICVGIDLVWRGFLFGSKACKAKELKLYFCLVDTDKLSLMQKKIGFSQSWVCSECEQSQFKVEIVLPYKLIQIGGMFFYEVV